VAVAVAVARTTLTVQAVLAAMAEQVPNGIRRTVPAAEVEEEVAPIAMAHIQLRAVPAVSTAEVAVAPADTPRLTSRTARVIHRALRAS
jgi:hypothetical protein